MSDKRTPEERTDEWNEGFKAGYEKSRADFIKNDLPKLLKLAREFEAGTWGCHRYSIADLIAMAEKGEAWNEVTAKP